MHSSTKILCYRNIFSIREICRNISTIFSIYRNVLFIVIFTLRNTRISNIIGIFYKYLASYDA